MGLIETPQLKKNSVSLIDSLLLKTGTVCFEVLEMMVHEQIRYQVKEFKTWEDFSLSFHENDIKPSDGIRHMIHEFLIAETLEKAFYLFSAGSTPNDQSAAPAPSPLMS